MKIALVGYGKMGQIIDQIAQSRGHEVVARLNETPNGENLNQPDVVIEFSSPDSAYNNIKFCLEQKIPVVCGTTGWLDRKGEIEEICKREEAAFLYGSNFSLGVNLFFALNEKLAQLICPFRENYQCQLEEIHHIHKLDAPSGTAKLLADSLKEENKDLKYVYDRESVRKPKEKNELGISSIRGGNIVGEHTVFFLDDDEILEITHKAESRAIFANGAIKAMIYMQGKKCVIYSIEDMIKN